VKTSRCLLPFAALCALRLLSAHAADPVAASAATAPPVRRPETPGQQAARIQWWHEARFGMFIHWGLYAIPAGVWKTNVHDTGYSEWIMFGEKIPAQEYARLATQFNPVRFDAPAWAALAQKAGMRYVVLTTKHHDGFSMFRSRLTPYNVVEATPFKRDVTGELAGACRAAGLRFGCYYSIDRDWYRPQGPGNRYRQNNVWDYPDSTPADFDRYLATFAKPQVEELLTQYRPDLLWFDEIDMKSDAQVEELYQSIRTLRPECLLNSRIQGCGFPKRIPPPHCDYITSGDNEILEKAPGFPWENPGSMNTSFGYNQNDHEWISAREIVARLVDIVSKGGNYLLNVGPTAEGLIPQPSVDRLLEVGAWLETNGEAIYGTAPWKIFQERSVLGPAAAKDPQKSAESTIDMRFTAKGNSVYALCMAWPVNGILVKALGNQGVPGQTITAVRMLGSTEAVTWRQTQDGLALSVPRKPPCRHAFVYRIDLH
jgi:alpha-L-fucosidase